MGLHSSRFWSLVNDEFCPLMTTKPPRSSQESRSSNASSFCTGWLWMDVVLLKLPRRRRRRRQWVYVSRWTNSSPGTGNGSHSLHPLPRMGQARKRRLQSCLHLFLSPLSLSLSSLFLSSGSTSISGGFDQSTDYAFMQHGRLNRVLSSLLLPCCVLQVSSSFQLTAFAEATLHHRFLPLSLPPVSLYHYSRYKDKKFKSSQRKWDWKTDRKGQR